MDGLGLFNGENMKKTDWLPCNEAPPIREGYYEVRLWEKMCIPANHGKVMRFYFDGKRWRNRSDGHRLVVEDRPGWHKKDEWRGVERPNVQIEAPDAALSRQVASNAGLGLDNLKGK